MISGDTEEIRCEIFPIPSAGVSGSTVSKHALFFHQSPEHLADSSYNAYIPTCSVHHDNVAAVQCMDCVKYGLPVNQSYHCSNKCFVDAWKKHLLYHLCATAGHCFNGDAKTLEKLKKRNSWPPGDMVSWFDERVEMVLPRGKRLVNSLGTLDTFVPLADDVGFSFKLGSTVLDNSQVALSAKDVLVTDPAIHRLTLSPRSIIRLADFKESERLGVTRNLCGVESFNILTYNVLSDIYAFPEKYFYCPQWALKWEYRRKNLLHEIILYDADILCLQEVQSDHFENFFKPELAKFGYSAVYKKKTKEVYTGNGYNIDGCAIFFRNDIFKKVISYELEYSKTAVSLIEKLEPTHREEARVRLIKDNVALILILEMVGDARVHASSWSRLCVVNTHIHAGKGSPDVKLLQVSDLVNEIEKIIDPTTPLLICGDINSVPESDPYVLLANQEVNPGCEKKSSDPLGIYQHLKLHHSFKLASAYTSQLLKPVVNIAGHTIMIDNETGEPLFTRLTPNRRSTLDYIFYTVDSLEVEGLLELLDYDSLGRMLPSPLWSSDHIALMANFRIRRPFL